jgi:hypothetical protein
MNTLKKMAETSAVLPRDKAILREAVWFEPNSENVARKNISTWATDTTPKPVAPIMEMVYGITSNCRSELRACTNPREKKLSVRRRLAGMRT